MAERNDLTARTNPHLAAIHQLGDHTTAYSRSNPQLTGEVLTRIGRVIATTLVVQPVAG